MREREIMRDKRGESDTVRRSVWRRVRKREGEGVDGPRGRRIDNWSFLDDEGCVSLVDVFFRTHITDTFSRYVREREIYTRTVRSQRRENGIREKASCGSIGRKLR